MAGTSRRGKLDEKDTMGEAEEKRQRRASEENSRLIDRVDRSWQPHAGQCLEQHANLSHNHRERESLETPLNVSIDSLVHDFGQFGLHNKEVSCRESSGQQQDWKGRMGDDGESNWQHNREKIEQREREQELEHHDSVLWYMMVHSKPHIFWRGHNNAWNYGTPDGRMVTAGGGKYYCQGVTACIQCRGGWVRPLRLLKPPGSADYSDNERIRWIGDENSILGVMPNNFGSAVHAMLRKAFSLGEYGNALDLYGPHYGHKTLAADAFMGGTPCAERSSIAATDAAVAAIQCLLTDSPGRRVAAVEYVVTSVVQRELGWDYHRKSEQGPNFLMGEIDLVLTCWSKGKEPCAALVDYKVRSRKPTNLVPDTVQGGGRYILHTDWMKTEDAAQLMWLSILYTMQTGVPVSEMWVIDVYPKGPYGVNGAQYCRRDWSVDFFAIASSVAWSDELIDATMPERWKEVSKLHSESRGSVFHRAIEKNRDLNGGSN
ncbi:unnamed protein product [Ostreobium quekettii]|uniref:Uncharacterized protein n=1 Tax=Ostreobium quekettii TaxID=121088 RepID=A0A8S1J2V9_9CHLO|nr:unnamed protein product [Ostreobium quekettii]|eukprot:evm.model.scf_1558EXC.4 EVM.evm.TU.scf_1558EXC.4   scf_1558EXC:33524-35462(-)